MKVYKVDITPLSLFKDFPSSYTLFGAISWGYFLLYGEEKLKKLLNELKNGNTPFLISSILPKKENNYYFPKPNLKAKRDKKADIDYKKLKKLQFVPFQIFKEVLDGNIENELELHKLMKSSQSDISLVEKDAIPHASIDRLYGTTEGSGGLFFEEVVALNEGYILVAVKDETIKEELKAVFKLLQDTGLGGNRSVGYGRIVFGKFEKFPEIENYFKNKTDRFITLAPVIPEKETYDLSNSYYDYFTFRGAVDNNYNFKDVDIWKDKVIYLKEGSTLKVKQEKTVYGQFYKSKTINGKEIYQYGLAFPLFIQGGN
ncbi:type III-A CRISPR-associated RAMP protein Csm4 [Hydrogenivirga sp. 128-5-R1-1]|uniref:type III-A CRISPR-associated RAMP protein Csm4 n=1 Tax=Hydrogenivirga sp. 128-5-R1-1 TaxID=392423 RepID=UPI00015F38E1|nr:type III-A CRISPR-associated RAMP protein Csm4 [Hydrogenivirga sp. 128-5-R1-1]EDP73385.1 hypothetical protein HG1285_09171 [Hydrogenivirga sp. 128-5-R1-1]